MVTLNLKNSNVILTEKQQKYQQYQIVKLINMIFIQAKKYYYPTKVE